MSKLTPTQMAKKAIFTRARAEGSVLRDYFLNEVLPELELEFDRRLASGQTLNLAIPEADTFAKAYVEAFFTANKALR